MTGLLLFGSLLLLMIIGVPVAFAILGCGAFVFRVTDLQPLVVVAQKLLNGMDSFPLIAVPLFIFAGNLMDKGGISKRLVGWCQCLVGNMRGGLGMAAIVACGVFAALTGSGPATVAAIGSIMIPFMVKDGGYEHYRATGLVTAAGALGPIIPPSIPIIVYGCLMGVSIPKMFIAAVGPGLLIIALLMVTNAIIARRTPSIMQAPRVPFSWKALGKSTVKAFGALLMPIIILGGIYGGIFTPTEAAAVACFYGLILGIFIYKELKIKELPRLIVDSMKVSAMAVFICACANLLNFVLSSTKLTTSITEALVANVTSPAIYITALIILLLIAGALLDVLAAITILAPLIVPAGLAMGIDPLYLSTLFVVTLVIGLITPPFGVNLFTASAVTGLKYEDVVKGTMPFMLAEIVAIVLVALFPVIITGLPAWIGK